MHQSSFPSICSFSVPTYVALLFHPETQHPMATWSLGGSPFPIATKGGVWGRPNPATWHSRPSQPGHSWRSWPHFYNLPRLHFLYSHKSFCPNPASPAPTQGPGKGNGFWSTRIFWPELPWGQAMKESPEAKAEGSGYWRDNLIISGQAGRRTVGEGGSLSLEN